MPCPSLFPGPCSKGGKSSQPLRWNTKDLLYFVFYLPEPPFTMFFCTTGTLLMCSFFFFFLNVLFQALVMKNL